jgi:hypothetical protein
MAVLPRYRLGLRPKPKRRKSIFAPLSAQIGAYPRLGAAAIMMGLAGRNCAWEWAIRALLEMRLSRQLPGVAHAPASHAGALEQLEGPPDLITAVSGAAWQREDRDLCP